MTTHKLHKKALSGTRAFIALMMLIAIWGSNPISGIAATLGTAVWIFMPDVVKYEEKIYHKLRSK